MNQNRSRLARERAGLSINQAARLVGLTSDDLALIEQATTLLAEHAGLLAELYQVRVEWMTGEVAKRDYASVDAIKDADKLTSHDRDIIAEFAASMPRRVTDKQRSDSATALVSALTPTYPRRKP